MFSPRETTAAQGAPPDADGNVNLALHYGATRPELLRAGHDPDRLLIMEVNPNLPRTRTLSPAFDNTIPVDVIDVLVEADGVPFSLEEPPPSAEDRAISGHALGFVADGATLQTGIGTIPNIVATELAAGPLVDSAFTLEMFTTGLMSLHQAGKVTNVNKGIFPGVSVTTFALGTSELYRWLDANDEVAFLDVEVVNDPTTIGRNANLVSINGALSVDLYGQVVADTIDGRQISGVGFTRISRPSRAPGQLPLADLSPINGGRCRHSGFPHRRKAARGLGGVNASPPHRGGHHRIRCRRADGAHGARPDFALVDIAHPDQRAELRKVADSLGLR